MSTTYFKNKDETFTLTRCCGAYDGKHSRLRVQLSIEVTTTEYGIPLAYVTLDKNEAVELAYQLLKPFIKDELG